MNQYDEVNDDLDEELTATDEQAEALNLSAEERKLVTQPYDLGVKSISSDIQTGRIKLAIEYQRKYVWDLGKASRLIESLLLNVPIPVCYFAEDESGAYEVIDGLQRLTTIKNYLEGSFALTGISVLSELEGAKFQDLAPRDQRRLENRTVRCIVITDDSHPDIKFDVFERLNTGAASLTAQELRNSVYRGALNDELKRLADMPYFTGLMGSFRNKRMDLEEMVLRFFALVDGVQQYKPPLRQFLNSHMRAHRLETLDESSVARFRECCEVVGAVLGDAPFKIAGSRNALNKALFDAIMVSVAFADREAMLSRASAVQAGIVALESEENFLTAIGRATADRLRMRYRISAVASVLRKAGVAVDLPYAAEEVR